MIPVDQATAIKVVRPSVEMERSLMMSLSYDFAGQVALVTGGNAGIGLAKAKAFAVARPMSARLWKLMVASQLTRP